MLGSFVLILSVLCWYKTSKNWMLILVSPPQVFVLLLTFLLRSDSQMTQFVLYFVLSVLWITAPNKKVFEQNAILMLVTPGIVFAHLAVSG